MSAVKHFKCVRRARRRLRQRPPPPKKNAHRLGFDRHWDFLKSGLIAGQGAAAIHASGQALPAAQSDVPHWLENEKALLALALPTRLCPIRPLGDKAERERP